MYEAGWHEMELISTGSSYTFTVDGEIPTLQFILGSNDGTWFDEITLRDNISIGATVDNDPNYGGGAVQWVKIDDGVNGDWHYNPVTNTFDDSSVLALPLAPVGTWP